MGPCTLRCMRAVFSAFKVYYVFAKNIGDPGRLLSSYGFIKADSRAARLYLTRVYTSSCCSACVDLVFTKFWVAISLRATAVPLSAIRDITHDSLSRGEMFNAQVAKVKLIFGLSSSLNLGIVLRYSVLLNTASSE